MKRRGIGFALVIGAGLLAAAGGLLWWRAETDPSRIPASDWSRFRNRFVSADGRVVDTGNGGVSHSEGQGYGMLLAEACGDRRSFDRIWNWTRTNLQTRPDDKLLSWQWKPSSDGNGGSVTDPNNASDGDLLVAWALVRASKRWGIYAYQQAAAEILLDLHRLAVRQTPAGPILLPGVHGFVKDSGTTLNGSYYVFPAFREIVAAFPGTGWDRVAAFGHQLLRQTLFGDARLNPDWFLDANGFYSLETQFPPDFGYNAIRIPLHLAWENPRSELLGTYVNFWRGFPDLSKMPATVNLETNTFGPDPALPGMESIARFTLAAGAGQQLAIRDIPPVSSEEPYYSASLKLLTKLAIRDTIGGRR
ncbi:MAG: glycosyl hydrolase family 8 [Terrimicrobiaceae bacterium]|nr:glycosyl hydrolase family 8 [Terrimicrobiaceae bacterium]